VTTTIQQLEQMKTEGKRVIVIDYVLKMLKADGDVKTSDRVQLGALK
jgi:endo-alpha-1,4-polygalactosaminidase (GH114 family)